MCIHYDDSVLYSLGVGFYNNYISTTQHWLACYDHPSDKAKFHCNFTVPKGYFVASNGSYVIHNLDDSTNVFEYTHNHLVATSLLTFNVGKFIEQKQEDSIAPINVYAQAKDTAATSFAFQYVPEMLSYFTETFGAYPFEKVGYVITDKGSMESQTMINFNRNELNRVFNTRDTSNPIAAHELSHQWFGDAITPFDFRDVWLNEAFATYCESLWLEHLYGKDKYFKDLLIKRNNYINNYIKSEGAIPLYDFPRNNKVSNYPATIYYKGAVVIGMIRYYIGDTLFFDFLKHYYGFYKSRNINTPNFIYFLDDYLGNQYTTFLTQWIYGIGVPIISIKISYQPSLTGSKYRITKISIEENNPQDWTVFEKFPINLAFIKNDHLTENHIVEFKLPKVDFIPETPIECDTISFLNPDIVISLADVREVTYELETGVQENEDLAQYIQIKDNQLIMDFSKFPAANFKLFDLMGRLILQDNQSNTSLKSYDLNNLSRGFYNLVVFDNNRLLFTKKIIIE